MNNGLFARVPLPRNMFNGDAYDPNRNYFNSDHRLSADTHGAIDNLVGREPTPDPAGDNIPGDGPFGFLRDKGRKYETGSMRTIANSTGKVGAKKTFQNWSLAPVWAGVTIGRGAKWVSVGRTTAPSRISRGLNY